VTVCAEFGDSRLVTAPVKVVTPPPWTTLTDTGALSTVMLIPSGLTVVPASLISASNSGSGPTPVAPG